MTLEEGGKKKEKGKIKRQLVFQWTLPSIESNYYSQEISFHDNLRICKFLRREIRWNIFSQALKVIIVSVQPSLLHLRKLTLLEFHTICLRKRNTLNFES